MALSTFQMEDWPPLVGATAAIMPGSSTTNSSHNSNNNNNSNHADNPNKTNNPPKEDWMMVQKATSHSPHEEDEEERSSKPGSATGGLAGFLEQTSNDNSTVATLETADTDLESTVGDFGKEPPQEDGDQGAGPIIEDDVDKPFDEDSAAVAAFLTTAVLEDDPKTRQVMHDSILLTLEALVLVMNHPNRTNRACEYALECIMALSERQYLSGRAGGKDDLTGSGSVLLRGRESSAHGANNAQHEKPPSLVHQLLMGVSKCSESNLESLQVKVCKTMSAILTCPTCGVHEASMLLAIRSTFHVYLVTKSQVCQRIAKLSLLQMIQSVFSRMESIDAILTRAPQLTTLPSPTSNTVMLSQFHTDSYVLLRSLCKLSSKELPGGDSDLFTSQSALRNFAQQFSAMTIDPLALNNKILSLELILNVMDHAGDAICHGEKFVHLVQTQLCVALLKNCMSNHTQVAFLSQKIFLILVYKFKTHLKQEIEVFMSNIFLRVLESPNSSFQQKALVLESLRSVCNDPVLLTQIFLNYDCDFDSMNLYKDIVFHLTKLSGKSTAGPIANLSKKDAEQQFELSLAGIEVLVAILKAFLRALGLPIGGVEYEQSDDTAGIRIRELLHLDVGFLDEVQEIEHATAGTAAAAVMKATVDASIKSAIPALEAAGADSAVGAGGAGGIIGEDDVKKSILYHQESSSDVAGKIVDAFDRKRTAEQNFELGAVKFTLSLKAGLSFFIENGFVTLNAKEIAAFFLQHKDKLDKTQMGEVLGKEPDAAFVKEPGRDPELGGPGFFVRILHHYVDAMNFTGLMFDDAIRLFLSGFRLPGEAQKIDRIMEKFAERFTKQNLDVFPSADTAFILAFSVIMLNTDLHNPSIKPEKRMTLDSFLRNNRGIGANGTDLPEDFLTGIYERIKERPFSLKEDDAAREKASEVLESSFFFDTGGSLFFGGNSEERKREKFKKEREEMMSATEQLIRRRPKIKVSGGGVASAKLREAVSPADVAKPMFDVTWGPMIGILSQVLECSSDERSIIVCLHGFVYAIRIAAHSNMSLVRETFVNSLAKFTFLGSIKEMKPKNIESIRTLLSIAVVDGEFLGESWGPVLQCISQLARMRMSASGLDSDESFLQDEKSGLGNLSKRSSTSQTDLSSDGSIFRQPTRAEISKETEESNNRAILEAVSEELIDKVFSSTVKLSARSLAHFIEQLVAVSKSEVAGETKLGITGVAASAPIGNNPGSGHGDQGPSIFSLQRLVEVADFNMDVRPRLVWTQVWGIMADYFAQIGCHTNSMVSVFAIDSLKQLTSKFLEKPELSEYNFQRIFLKPFLQIMQNPGTREDIRELVLQCVDITIRTKSHHLASGWKIIFGILTESASDPSEKIIFLGLNILERLLDEHLDQVCRLSDGMHDGVDHHHDEIKAEDLSALERRNRNSNAEEFMDLCKASLSFVQRKDSASIRPTGSTMRALCHTAIYADLLADHRVEPPASGAQCTHPEAPGYTYTGLNETEALEMVLWRPIFDGLAEGVCSKARSSAGGIGCLVQRGSVLALRAILLRHGSMFTIHQLKAILEQAILPAIRAAVETDQSPVIGITSESPSVSSLDFLADSMPPPPPIDDPGLLKFADAARSNGL